MADRTATLDEAVALVPDGTQLGIGGVLLKRKPMGFLAALVRAGRTDLTALTFLGSLDVELLAAAGSLAGFRGGYVGFEQLGMAPAFRRLAEDGTVAVAEYSEFLFVSGLRASAAGLPFLPTLGATGSDLVDELGIRTVTDPYAGQDLLAAPAIRPEVTVVHAEVADVRGNVAGPATPDFLSDFDVNLARASERVIVTAERLVPAGDLAGRVALFGHEVTAVVELALGAAPTGLPGVYPADLDVVERYLAIARDDPVAAAAMLLEASS